MAFNWEVFLDKLGGGIQQAGTSYFNMMMREKQMEQDAARDLETYREKAKIEDKLFKERESLARQHDKTMENLRLTNTKELNDYNSELESKMDRFLGSAEAMNEMESYLTPSRPEAFGVNTNMIKASIQSNLFQKVKRREGLDERDLAGLAMLSSATQGVIGQANTENQIFNAEQQRIQESHRMTQSMQAKLGKYYDAMAGMSTTRGTFSAQDKFKLIQGMTSDRDSVLNSQEYVRLRGLFELNPETGDWGGVRNVRGKEAKVDKNELARFTALHKGVEMYESMIGQLTQSMQSEGKDAYTQQLEDTIRNLTSPQQVEPPPSPPEQPGDIDQLGGFVERTAKRAGVVTDPYRAQVVSRGTEFETKVSGKDRRKMEEHAKSKGLMPDEVVHIDEVADATGGYNQEMLQELQRAGKFVFFEGKLHKIVMRGGKLGLVPVVE